MVAVAVVAAVAVGYLAFAFDCCSDCLLRFASAEPGLLGLCPWRLAARSTQEMLRL